MTMETEPGTDTRIVGAAGIRKDRTAIMQVSWCPACSSRWFPPRTVCSACANDHLDQFEAGMNGVAYASSVVRIGPAGFEVPYVLTYVDIEGVRVLAHADVDNPDDPQPLPPDTPVTFTSGPTGHDGETQLVSYRARRTDQQGEPS